MKNGIKKTKSMKFTPQAPAVTLPARTLTCLCAAMIGLSVVAGCKSRSPSQYVSPRVIGRVLDAHTHQPVQGVQVKRVVPDYEARSMDPVRGGEIMQRTQPINTKADGSFNLDSEKSVALFREIAWFGVEISFKHRDYETVITNYTPRQAITSSDGEPVIYAGDVIMPPKAK